MRTKALGCLLVGAGVLFAAPRPALAQYKNTSFGFDLSGWLITKPSILDADGDVISNPNNRPLRLGNGGRLGGETNLKLDEDHWWASFRVNLSALQLAGETTYDADAKEALGTLVGVQGQMGIRYVIFTDKVRPYIQASLSYLRLFSFANAAGQACASSDAVVCASGGTNADNFLPHPNVGGLHLTGGVEFIIVRDLALHFYIDGARWIIFNAADNNSIAFGLGIIFFT